MALVVIVLLRSGVPGRQVPPTPHGRVFLPGSLRFLRLALVLVASPVLLGLLALSSLRKGVFEREGHLEGGRGRGAQLSPSLRRQVDHLLQHRHVLDLLLPPRLSLDLRHLLFHRAFVGRKASSFSRLSLVPCHLLLLPSVRLTLTLTAAVQPLLKDALK